MFHWKQDHSGSSNWWVYSKHVSQVFGHVVGPEMGRAYSLQFRSNIDNLSDMFSTLSCDRITILYLKAPSWWRQQGREAFKPSSFQYNHHHADLIWCRVTFHSVTKFQIASQSSVVESFLIIIFLKRTLIIYWGIFKPGQHFFYLTLT